MHGQVWDVWYTRAHYWRPLLPALTPPLRAHSPPPRLHGSGHSAFIAGGWVRDRFLGRPPADIDIATSATVSEVRTEAGGVNKHVRTGVGGVDNHKGRPRVKLTSASNYPV